MTVYSLYIFDRHCTCIYYHDWHRSKRPKPAVKDALLPGVSRAVSYQPPATAADGGVPTTSTFSSPRNTLTSTSGVVVAVHSEEAAREAKLQNGSSQSIGAGSMLPFDEETKLVYGVVLSLRNMVKKLSKRDEQFTGYRTSTYKLHLYETSTNYKFILLTDPRADMPSSSSTTLASTNSGASSNPASNPVRYALRQIHAGPFLDYVVRNPLVPMDSRTQGIDNEYFRASVDRLVRSLSIFQ